MNTKASRIRAFNVRTIRGSTLVGVSSYTSGFVHDDSSSYSAVSDEEVISAALRILSSRMVSTPALSNPRTVQHYFAVRFEGLEHEVFACLYLDNRHRVIHCEELFRGTVNCAAVYPREVAKRALAHNAAAVIFAHNHPSANAEPSQADMMITRQLKEGLGLLEIRVLDHLVIGGSSVVSFAERGLL